MLQQTGGPEPVLVVDDGSTDAGAELAKSKNVRLIQHPRNLGLAAARNSAMQNADSEILIYFDVDAIPEKNCIEFLLAGFSSDDVVAVGGRGNESGAIGHTAKWRARVTPQSHGDTIIEDDWMLMGLCIAFRKDALLNVGGFDPRFRLAGEDADISMRLKKQGGRLVYQPGAMVSHMGASGFFAVMKQSFIHARYATFAIVKNRNSPRPYITDTFRTLMTQSLRDLLAGRVADAGIGIVNLGIRKLGIFVGLCSALFFSDQ